MKSGKAGRKRGRPEISYLLNEPQLDYLLRIIRGRDPERVNQFKLDVTKAFTIVVPPSLYVGNICPVIMKAVMA